MADDIKKSNFEVFAVKLISNGNVYTIYNEDIIDLYFIEDIYSFCLTGKISFYDKYGIAEMLPFTGHEMINVIYEEKDRTEIVFKLYSVDDISPITDVSSNKIRIDAYLVEPTYFNLMHKRYSRSWNNKKISDIVKDISKNMVRVDTFKIFEDTKETLPYFYMPYWTPAEAIRWLIERASGAESKTAGYLYYFTTQGLNFVTIDKLFQSKTIETDANGVPIEYTFINTTGGTDYNHIYQWDITSIDYSSIMILRGSHMLGFDFENKKLIDNEFTYKDSISKYTMLGNKTLYPDISYSGDYYNLSGEEDDASIQNLYHNDFIKRYSKQLGIVITVRGHERRYPGSMISIKWPSIDEKNQVSHPELNGTYLIKSVTNYFNPRSEPVFIQKMVCIKNAYTDSKATKEMLLASTKINKSTNARKLGNN